MSVALNGKYFLGVHHECMRSGVVEAAVNDGHYLVRFDDLVGFTDGSKWPEALVGRFIQIEGYRCLSLTRAVEVVNCQFALVWLAFRSRSQASISSIKVCLSGIRRSRHWDDRTPSSDSARSSQLPCFGV